MFIRIIALGSGCEPPGGAAPIIELRAGTGELANVPRSPDEGTIRDETQTEVATATWTREVDDIFMVELTIGKKNTRLWRLRITNNDPEELGFVWVTSEDADDARQPRISMQRGLGRTARLGEPIENIVAPIANIGTKTMKFRDRPGTDMGNGFTLVRVPESIRPNACGSIEIRVDPIGASVSWPARYETEYVLKCDVVDAKDKTISLGRYQKTAKEKEKDNKDKEKDGAEKGHKDGPLEVMKPVDTFPPPFGRIQGDEPGSVSERLAGLERTVSELVHFIRPDLRPDLATSALAYEDQGHQDGKHTKEAKEMLEKPEKEVKEGKEANEGKVPKDVVEKATKDFDKPCER
ncbi:hypothetical protein ACIGEZ_20940 [Streptomyces sp. NPDC085481]|uniref:hypothetical protein n=1 Tax=Streptomyces sp. NPDC085481 TaxID=3365727 RepID=UPI0037D58D86